MSEGLRRKSVRVIVSCGFFLGVLCASAGCNRTDDEANGLVVFAAASLRDVVTEIGREYEQQTGTPIVFNFAGSNALARQIEAAPVADVFLSANPRWVDFIEQRGLVAVGSRIDFASNRLVVIAHRDYPHGIDGLRYFAELPFKYLALANPEAVPAGIYARSELESRKVGDGTLWDRISDRIVPTLDVRAAMGLVAADPEIIGIVYATDVASSKEDRILHTIMASGITGVTLHVDKGYHAMGMVAEPYLAPNPTGEPKKEG